MWAQNRKGEGEKHRAFRKWLVVEDRVSLKKKKKKEREFMEKDESLSERG